MDDASLDAFFGDLYFETTIGLLTPRITENEARLIARKLDMAQGGLFLDLGCGHGRHLKALMQEEESYRVVGIDRSLPYLKKARSCFTYVKGERQPRVPEVTCGDFRALPFPDRVFAGAFSWYSGLFLFDEDTNLKVLNSVAAALEPGGLLLHQGANPEELCKHPLDRHQGLTPLGGEVEELARFDPESGREYLWRRLVRADGSVLEGEWSVRHYRPEELEGLLTECGLVLEEVFDSSGKVFDAGSSYDMVALCRKR